MKRIALHSVPRSGSTWLGAIFDSHPEVVYKYQPLFSYRFKDYLIPMSGRQDIVAFFNEIANVVDDFTDQIEAKDKGIVPSFKKTNPKAIVYKEVRYHHLLFNMLEKDSDLRVIGLIRNPLSVIHSWLNAPKEFRADKGWKIEEEWQFAPKKNLKKPEEFNGYEKWKEVASMFERFKQNYPSQFFLLPYRSLLEDTPKTVQQLFEFCGLRYNEQTDIFIKNSKAITVNDAYGVFRKNQRDDKWRGRLADEIVAHICTDLAGTDLQKYLDY